jgi:hypothetical protein
LTRSLHFPSNATGRDIYCSSVRGPNFDGGDGIELGTYEPFNGKEKCRSRANYPGYKIPEVNGKNQLTDQEGIDFTISELEVWLLVDEK